MTHTAIRSSGDPGAFSTISVAATAPARAGESRAPTAVMILVEPGALAVSDLLQRARPDEAGGTSPQGLAWCGSHGSRYNAGYGDRRMPSTTQSTATADWTDQPTDFDTHPEEFQILYDWVAQGAPP